MEQPGPNVPSTQHIMSISIKRSEKEIKQTKAILYMQNLFIENSRRVTENIIVEKATPYMMLHTNLTEGPIKILIDTGASVSIIAKEAITNEIDTQDTKYKLLGFNSKRDGVTTAGIANAEATIGGKKLKIPFHMVEKSCLGNLNGLLGFDFLIRYGASIDLSNNKIHFEIANPKEMEIGERNENDEKEAKEEMNEDVWAEHLKNFNIERVDKRQKKIRRQKYDLKQMGIRMNKMKEADEATEDGNKKRYADYTEVVRHQSILIEEAKKRKVNMIVYKNTSFHTKNEHNMRTRINENEEQGRTNNTPHDNDTTRLNIMHITDKKGGLTAHQRFEYIISKLKLKHCTDEEKTTVENICSNFPFQFYIEGDKLGSTSVIEHRIRIIPGSKIVNVRQYRIPHGHRKPLEDIIADYEEQGIIEKCQSHYNSPAMLVPKKDDNNEKKDFRFVVDFKKLNETCEILNFPIPLIDDILDGLGDCKYFTTLDIKGAFHQITLEGDSRDYTAFTVGHFQYRWIRMPMGLAASPLTWQRAINIILSELIGNGVYVYLDDIIIYGKTIMDHNNTLCEVMMALKKYNLQLKITKCNFFAKEFDYLGFVIAADGIKVNQKKVEAIREFPTPKNEKQIQSFLGLINYYRRFIKDLARLAKPLTTLLKTEVPFVWTETTQRAFDTLRQTLIENVVLKFPNFDELFYVTTDASDIAIGAVLSQGELPNDRPIHFFSRTLNDAQKRYSTIQKELLAIVEAIKTFRVYLYGRYFILITDHKPLCYLFTMKDCGSRLFRQRLEIMNYNFKILYKPGVQNTVADALSRMEPVTIQEAIEMEKKQQINALTRAQANNELNNSDSKHFTVDEKNGTILNKREFDALFHLVPVENNTLKDTLTNKFGNITFSTEWYNFRPRNFTIIISNQFSSSVNEHKTIKCIRELHKICMEKNFTFIAINVDFDNIRHYLSLKGVITEIFKNTNFSITIFLNKIIDVTEIDDRRKILDLYHRSLLGGHFGRKKMYETITRFYNWRNITNDIRNYINGCEICKKSKVIQNTRVPMQISSLGEILYDHTYIDFVGPISPPSSEGHKYIFTATCDLTKYMTAVPTFDCSAITSADCLLNGILLQYNFPSRIISDNASNFNSKVIHELTKTLRIKKIFTTPYHPQSNIVERTHRTLNSYMRAFTAKNRNEWHNVLKFAMFAYNNSVHTTTGYTPHELAHGFRIQIPSHLYKQKTIYNYDSLADRIRNQIADTLEVAKEHLHNRKLENKKEYDKNAKKLNVEIGDHILFKTQQKDEKFQFIYEGPYEVTKAYDEYVEIVKNNRKMKIHKNLIKLYERNDINMIDAITQLEEIHKKHILSISDEGVDVVNGNHVEGSPSNGVFGDERPVGIILQGDISGKSLI